MVSHTVCQYDFEIFVTVTINDAVDVAVMGALMSASSHNKQHV